MLWCTIREWGKEDEFPNRILPHSACSQDVQTLFSFANKLKSLFEDLASRRRGPWQLCQPRIEGSTAATSAKPPVEQMRITAKHRKTDKSEYCRHWREVTSWTRNSLHCKVWISDLCDIEAHDEVEREDVFIAANVDTPVWKMTYHNKIRLKD